jgi:hypothetical protein
MVSANQFNEAASPLSNVISTRMPCPGADVTSICAAAF